MLETDNKKKDEMRWISSSFPAVLRLRLPVLQTVFSHILEKQFFTINI